MILVCSICGASHYTQNCPDFAKGDHIKDKPSLNLSRSSVPNGLLIMDSGATAGAGAASSSTDSSSPQQSTTCVVTSQKFAKGTRFGPLLAQKSYTPIKGLPFPLVLFANTPPSYYYGTDLLALDFELQTLLSGRNVYLDTRNESKCNWMIHVSLARFSNEQNLICYQENDEIYYTAIRDIELGDILRVWYSRSYAAKIGAALLEPSPYDICNNILRSVSLDYGLDLDQNQNYLENCFPSSSSSSGGHQLIHHHPQQQHQQSTSSSSMMIGGGGSDVNNNGGSLASMTSGEGGGSSSYDKISLPPIDSLMKTTSPKYTTNHYHMFDLDLIGGTSQSCEDYGQFNPVATSCSPSLVPIHHHHQHHSSQLSGSPTPQQFGVQQLTDMHHHQQQQQQLVHSTYSGYQQQHQQTLPEDTLSPADLINISLGASDMNIAFDSFEAGQLISYDGGNSSSGSNLADSGISLGHGGNGLGLLDNGSKLHSRYSSSTDSLVTLNDSIGGGGGGGGGGAMVPVAPSSVTPIPAMGPATAALAAVDPEADKKYPCEICLRKYMTKSNLDKHMRKHNLFLCVFCMKLFQLAEELKDHECTERKSKTAYLHCPKCLKVLSNSWSLQRHMKIHKDPNGDHLSDGLLLRQQSSSESSDKMVLLAGTSAGTTNETIVPTKDSTITTTIDIDSSLPAVPFDELESTGLDEVLKPGLEPFQVQVVDDNGDSVHHHHHHHLLDMAGDEANDGTVLLEAEVLPGEMDVEQQQQVEFEVMSQPAAIVALPSITTIPITNTSSSQDMITDVQAPNGKQLYKCIVCAKLFKNPNALEKHLRKVHTVYTISNDYKTEKKVLTQINQKKTSPIKPAIAKALATKLTQKSKKMEAAAASGNGGSPATAGSPAVGTPVEQQVPQPPPVHVPRPYNKKKHLNNVQKLPTATATTPMQVTTIPAAPTPTPTPGKSSHSIIIISNLELTNNNLIDTSQLFLNQNSNALGNKIDVKVLNSTDKLPKLVPISSHSAGPTPPSHIPPPTPQQFVGIPSLHPTTPTPNPPTAPSSSSSSETGSCALNALIESSGINVVDESQDQQLLTLSPIKVSNGGSADGSNSFLGPDELSADANDSNLQQEQMYDGDSGDSSSNAPHQQLTSTLAGSASSSYPCEECDRVFPKNYQLKRHMEIHDSTYYMCPYCDRSPLKAKTSVRKHLNTVHPERAPPKEEMNKFIATLVVRDEKILNELFIKNERKIRAKCAKQQAKQLQLQMQKQQLQAQQQQQQQAVVIVQDASTSVATTVPTSATVVEQQEELLGAYSDGGQQEQDQTQQTVTIVENSQQLGGYESEENVGGPGTDRGSSSASGTEGRSDDENVLKRRAEGNGGSGSSTGECSGGSSSSSNGKHTEEVKRIKLVDANGQEVRYIAASNGGTALKYLRKKSIGVGEGSSMHPPGNAAGQQQQSNQIDNQMILDNLFDNISIENYEFDDNTSIQSYNMIEERFKTSFDQIQEKLDAELSFDEEQLKWQNNLMANDSSNEIGDKLLNVEDNVLLI